MYHGILIDQEFANPSFPETFEVFAKKKDDSWKIYGVEVENSKISKAINETKKAMKKGKWYCHFYNKDVLWVVFKDKTFRVKSDKSTWKPIIKYGRQLNISQEQLDFWPNRFQDEIHYFAKEEFR